MKAPQSLKIACLLCAVMMLPAVVQAQFLFTTNNDGSLNIYQNTGSGGAVTIPSTTNGLPVTSIGDYAFYGCSRLTSVMIGINVTSIGGWVFYGCPSLSSVIIGNSVTSIGDFAFAWCPLTSLTIPNSVTSIGYAAFEWCNLTNLTIPNSVTSIESYAFNNCHSLTNVTIGSGVTYLADDVFFQCFNLTGVYFKGNAPSLGGSFVFSSDNNVTVYYLPGTTGWGTPGTLFDGFPTALWFLPNPLILNYEPNFGVKTNQFGFIISWATNIPVVVEACTNLVNPVWSQVGTNTLTGGSSYFSDPQWTNYPSRFYRIRSP
jgi:hypothetical protein